MPRRVEDIIPGGHRSIREVKIEKPVSKRAEQRATQKVSIKRIHEKEPEETEEVEEIQTEETPIKKPPAKKKRSRGKGKKIFLLIVVCVVLLGGAAFAATTVFSRAVFTLTPREVPVAVNNTLIASAAPSGTTLAYDLISFKTSASTTVEATIGARTEVKAKGLVTLYNVYTTSAWKLIAGTRLSGENGLVYRLSSSVSIPGYTKSSTGTLVPGTIAVSVVADQPGDEYNVSSADPLNKLHVVAYQNNVKYESIYGKTTSPITGGFIGNKVSVSQSSLSSTTAELVKNLKAGAAAKLKSQVPEDYVMYPEGIIVVTDPASVNSLSSSRAAVAVNATVYGITFKRSELVAKLAGLSAVDSFKTSGYQASGLEDLDFTISNAKDFSPARKNTLIFKVNGSMNLIGKIPVDELKSRFAGKALSDTEDIIREYGSVINLEKSSGQVVPPWSKIPANPNRIYINIQE